MQAFDVNLLLRPVGLLQNRVRASGPNVGENVGKTLDFGLPQKIGKNSHENWKDGSKIGLRAHFPIVCCFSPFSG